MPAKLTHAEFLDRVSRLSDGTILIRSDYVGMHSKVHAACSVCSHEWHPYAGNLVANRAGCQRCTFARKIKPAGEIHRRIEANGRVTVKGHYQGMRIPLLVTCNACRHSWHGTPHDLEHGHGCPACAGKLLDHTQAVERIRAHYGPAVEVVGTFSTTAARLALKCTGCAHEWAPTANSALQGRTGCLGCNHKGFNPAKPALVYCVAFAHSGGDTLYKVGITNRTPAARYNTTGEWGGLTLRGVERHDTGAAARARERELLTRYAHLRFRGSTGMSFSNIEVFLTDVLALDRGTSAYRRAT